MKKLYLVIVLNLMVILVSAQTIRGKVIDEELKPVMMANVVVVDEEDEFVSGTATDQNGSFSLTLSIIPDTIKNARVVISYVGMKNDTLKLSQAMNTKKNTIVLEVDEHILQDITVTAKRAMFSSKGNILTANVENTLLAKSGTFDQLMNKIPFVSGSNGQYTVFGRGDALIYLNDRKIYDSNELRILSSDRVKKVEVITNPGSKYSAEVKAVIKIYTKDNPEGLGGNIMAYLQNGKELSHFESSSLVYNKGKLQVSGEISYNDTRNAPSAQDNTEILSHPTSLTKDSVDIRFKGSYASANVGMNYNIDTSSNIGFVASLSSIKNLNDVHLKSLEHFVDGVKDFESSATVSSHNDPLQWLLNGYFNAKIGNSTSFELTNDFMLGRRRNLFDYTEQSKANVHTNGMMHYVMNSLILDFNTQLNVRLSLNYGAELTYSGNKQTFRFDEYMIDTELSTSNNKSDQILNAEYFNIVYNIGKWTFNAGLRCEYTHLNYYVNNVKSNDQNPTYNNLFPNVNIDYAPSSKLNLSLSYRMTINRPNYALLSDNQYYLSRFAYSQGNSLLKPEITQSINGLASVGNFKVIASYHKIKNTFMAARSIYGDDSTVILSRTVNMPEFERLNVGLCWSDKFHSYSPYLELNYGQQYFEYEYMGAQKNYNRPYLQCRINQTLNLPKQCNLSLNVSYNSNRYDLMRERSYQWSNSFSFSKSFKNGIFVQLSCNNFFCSNKNTSITYSGWIKDTTVNEYDYQNISLLVSWNFNPKNKKYNKRHSSSEIKRF